MMEALFSDGALLQAAAGSNTTNVTFPDWVLYSVKGVVGAACCLSILGASLIVFTYLAFPELRTTLRQILVNLSIADFLAASANLVGLCINFYKYLDKSTLQLDDRYNVLQYVCKVQAGVSVIGTLAALTWTLSIAVYMFMFIVLKRPELANKLLPLHYVLSWGCPILLTVIFGSLDWLGFEPYTTPGYCDIRAVYNKTHVNYAPVILRYTIPVDLSVIILPPIFIVIRCYLQKMVTHSCSYSNRMFNLLLFLSQVKKSSQSFAGSETAVKSADKKLIFVPLIFVVLRIWNVISDPMLFYFRNGIQHTYPALIAVILKVIW